MTDMSTIFVIDDDQAVRESLSLLLEQNGFSVEVFASAQAFLESLPAEMPDSCAIVDIRMPGMDGLQLQAELSRRGALLPIIFLTGHGNIPLSVRAMKAGAADFLTKPVSVADLTEKVLAALHESKKLYAELERSKMAGQRALSLTQRESQVWALLVEGLSNKEVARRLEISHRTVELHRMRIMKKTGTNNLLELADLYNLGHQ